jgi:hypothetical protein
MSDVSSTIYERDLMKTKGYPSSNLDRTLQNERMGLDRGGSRGSEVAAMGPISGCGLALWGWRGMTNSPKRVLGVDGDQSEACDSGWFSLSFGGGVNSWQ